jgi:hypothetical protein
VSGFAASVMQLSHTGQGLRASMGSHRTLRALGMRWDYLGDLGDGTNRESAHHRMMLTHGNKIYALVTGAWPYSPRFNQLHVRMATHWTYLAVVMTHWIMRKSIYVRLPGD